MATEEQKRLAKEAELALISQCRSMLGEVVYKSIFDGIPTIFKDGGIRIGRDTLNAFVEGINFIEALGQKTESFDVAGLLLHVEAKDRPLFVKGIAMAVLMDFRNKYEADLEAKTAGIV